jgi:hypothetical protein
MVVRRLVAFVVCATVAAALGLPATPAYATPPADVYVTTGGTDNPDCSQASPCATVAAAVQAVADLGTVHVGGGTFDGPVKPGAVAKSVTIDGVSPAATTLTYVSSDDFTVVNLYGGTTTTLSNLAVDDTGAVFTPVLVNPDGHLIADNVTVDGGVCGIAVLGGTATVADSTVQNGGGYSSCTQVSGQHVMGDIGIAGGAVTVTGSRLLAPAVGSSGIDLLGGTLTVDQSLFDSTANQADTNVSSGVRVQDGTATVQRSAFDGFDTGLRVVGGTALARDSTFFHNVVGASSLGGDVTLVRSTFENLLGDVYGESGSLSLAGSVLGPVSQGGAGRECSGTVVDLGYNLAGDGLCAFTASTSDAGPGALNLDTALSDRGGPVPTVAILDPSSAADTIPAGATYGVSATPLCGTGSTDLRGVPRPVGGACDAGSMELAGTTTTLRAPATAKPHADVTLDAGVGVPQVIDGLESPVGTVTFRAGAQVLCQDVAVASGAASCTTSALAAGSRSVTARFTPADGSTLHASFAAARTIKVGSVPDFTSKSRTTFHVGQKKTFTVHASGSPSPRITLVKGRLPAGLRFHAGRGTATVSGRALGSGVGIHRLTFRAKNLRGTVRQVLRIVVTR